MGLDVHILYTLISTDEKKGRLYMSVSVRADFYARDLRKRRAKGKRFEIQHCLCCTPKNYTRLELEIIEFQSFSCR